MNKGRHRRDRWLDRGRRGHSAGSNPFGGRIPRHSFNYDRPALLVRTLAGADNRFNACWIRVNYRSRGNQQCVEPTNAMLDAVRDAGVRRIVRVSITNPDPDPDLPCFRGQGELEDALSSLRGCSHAIL